MFAIFSCPWSGSRARAVAAGRPSAGVWVIRPRDQKSPRRQRTGRSRRPHAGGYRHHAQRPARRLFRAAVARPDRRAGGPRRASAACRRRRSALVHSATTPPASWLRLRNRAACRSDAPSSPRPDPSISPLALRIAAPAGPPAGALFDGYQLPRSDVRLGDRAPVLDHADRHTQPLDREDHLAVDGVVAAHGGSAR